MTALYRQDLAYIHDAGHGDFTRLAAPWLLRTLRRAGAGRGLVVDLGCGSGIWARALVDAGYDVLGIDLSRAMIALARKRAPRARFRVASFRTARLPRCVAVTALGECFSYLSGPAPGHGLLSLFRRIYAALEPRGLLIFDVAVPGRTAGRGPEVRYRDGNDWAVVASLEEDRRRRLLTRRITSFVKDEALYRRDDEVHRQRLFDAREVAAALRRAGFRVIPLAGYGRSRFLPGQAGFLARKPGREPPRSGPAARSR